MYIILLISRYQTMITVKYFAYLRERIGRDEDAVEAEGIATVGELRRVLADGGDAAEKISGALCAVNYEYADDDAPVADGDEVAFFPPVTGG